MKKFFSYKNYWNFNHKLILQPRAGIKQNGTNFDFNYQHAFT